MPDVYIYVDIRIEVHCCLKVRTLPSGLNISWWWWIKM